MQTLQIAILAIFILFQSKVQSQETLETVSESLVNGTIEDESIETETRPQQCKQNLKQYFMELVIEYFNDVNIFLKYLNCIQILIM